MNFYDFYYVCIFNPIDFVHDFCTIVLICYEHLNIFRLRESLTFSCFFFHCNISHCFWFQWTSRQKIVKSWKNKNSEKPYVLLQTDIEALVFFSFSFFPVSDFFSIGLTHVFPSSRLWHFRKSDELQSWHILRSPPTDGPRRNSSSWRHQVSCDVTLKVHVSHRICTRFSGLHFWHSSLSYIIQSWHGCSPYGRDVSWKVTSWWRHRVSNYK